MKVNISIDLTDDTLRQIRAHFGRGGRATRNECRVWLNHLINGGKEKLPPAKTRACNTSRRKDVAPAAESTPMTPQAKCALCGYPWEDHTGRRSSCVLSKGVKPGSTFKAVQA